jgi:glycine/D-amino acid oxidase-like deaminating enzyme
VLEQNAGYLEVENCVREHLNAAAAAGAVCRHHQRVHRWEVDGKGVRVTTDDSSETAERLVIAGGPWTATLAGGLGFQLDVVRKHQYWLATQDARYDVETGFPCFFFETDAGYFYGFPSIRGCGVKVARHSGGQPVDRPSDDASVDEDDRQQIDRFINDCLPGVSHRLLAHFPCYYTMTPDEHFIIDRCGEHDQVTVIAGLSGHGFKFTSVLGEVACQLATTGSTSLDISLFRIDRFL